MVMVFVSIICDGDRLLVRAAGLVDWVFDGALRGSFGDISAWAELVVCRLELSPRGPDCLMVMNCKSGQQRRCAMPQTHQPLK